jgi:hypothetical protein
MFRETPPCSETENGASRARTGDLLGAIVQSWARPGRRKWSISSSFEGGRSGPAASARLG